METRGREEDGIGVALVSGAEADEYRDNALGSGQALFIMG